VRVSSQTFVIAVLWVLAAWPPLLWLLFRTSPEAAIDVDGAVKTLVWRLVLAGGAFAGIALLLFPPFAAGLRLFAHRSRMALTADRSAYMRALSELRNLETASRHLEVGRMALQLRERPVAAQHLLRALELDGSLVSARVQLAQLLVQLGRLGEAEAQLRAVVAQDPGHAFGDALLLLGRIRYLAGDAAGAAELLRRHAREHGGGRRSHFWLAQSLVAAGDLDGAREALAFAAAPPPAQRRLTPEEGWFRAKARVLSWRKGWRA
jgi:tetratricopeptide (TPR) repeat protein